jgi:hypothetical protein
MPSPCKAEANIVPEARRVRKAKASRRFDLPLELAPMIIVNGSICRVASRKLFQFSTVRDVNNLLDSLLGHLGYVGHTGIHTQQGT